MTKRRRQQHIYVAGGTPHFRVKPAATILCITSFYQISPRVMVHVVRMHIRPLATSNSFKDCPGTQLRPSTHQERTESPTLSVKLCTTSRAIRYKTLQEVEYRWCELVDLKHAKLTVNYGQS